ncbi:complement factor H-related protein 1-like [Centroberyx affinis]|uniref:complement factor H-related protein 1-like n=1 Tax=Centroberyx affinis TaxID=166261 RepID=UPI003A5C4091
MANGSRPRRSGTDRTQPISGLMGLPGEKFWIVTRSHTSAEVTCTDDGTWSIPSLVCQAIKCSLSLPPLEGTSYEPKFRSVFSPGDTLTVTCAKKFWIVTRSHTSAEVTCTDDGTWSIPSLVCQAPVGCGRPPVLADGDTKDSVNVTYAHGERVEYVCQSYYTLDVTVTCAEKFWIVTRSHTSAEVTCTDDGTWSIPSLVCQDSCPKPQVENGYGVGPYNGTFFYSCNEGYKPFTKGWWSEAKCNNGVWPGPLRCIDIACQAEVMHPHLIVTGLPSADETTKQGHKLQFECGLGYSLEGVEEVECLETGQWDAHFPTCSEACIVPHIPASVRLTTRVTSRVMRQGSKLRFFCPRGQFLQGSAEVECLANRQWSDYIPTCGAPVGCGRAPLLEGGDIKYSVKYLYDHGERVEYICQTYYILDGLSHKTCHNGEWTGEMRCLKPCTVNEADMRKNNIAFRYTYQTKLYAEHNDEMSFSCAKGRHDGRLEMRQRCNDGEISLPSCQ